MYPAKLGTQQFKKAFDSSRLNENVIPRTLLSEDQNNRYFDQFKKLYYTSFCIQAQMKQFKKINNDLKNKVQNAEINVGVVQTMLKNNEQEPSQQKVKRFRRTNQMIQRTFRCNYPKCDKAYASEGSLQQHIRLKHEDSEPIYFHTIRPTKRQTKFQAPPDMAPCSSSFRAQQNSQSQQKQQIQLKLKQSN